MRRYDACRTIGSFVEKATGNPVMSQPPLAPRPPLAGCLVPALILLLLCLIPVYFLRFIETALGHLHLTPTQAALAMFGILFGSLINIPVYRIPRDEEVTYVWDPWGLSQMVFPQVPIRRETIIAVNVGGCVIPVLVAIWQIRFIVGAGPWPVAALLVAMGANIALSYRMARPMPGIGIVMPAWVAPLTAIGTTCLLLSEPQYDAIRAPVAFVAGITGPLVGADLLHLRRVLRLPVGMLSIGGAGTLDGIVLSGLLAALVCGWMAS